MIVDWIIKILGITVLAAFLIMMIILTVIMLGLSCAGFDLLTESQRCYDYFLY